MAKKPNDLVLFTSAFDPDRQREFSKALVKKVVGFIAATPGHTVRFYANQRDLQISETIINAILEYTPQGNTLVRKGMVAVANVGALANWTEISGAKIVTAPNNETQQIKDSANATSTALALADHAGIGEMVGSIMQKQQDIIFRMKVVPRRRFKMLDELDAQVTALAEYGLTQEKAALTATAAHEQTKLDFERRLAAIEKAVPLRSLPAPSNDVDAPARSARRIKNPSANRSRSRKVAAAR